MAGQLRVDEITDEAGTGSPSFPFGLPVGYAAGGTAPAAGSFTEVPSNVLEVGDPIRSSDIIAIKDNTLFLFDASFGFPIIDQQRFDASGTWTKPNISIPEAATVVAVLVGGGGAGARMNFLQNNFSGGGGGGTGGIAISIFPFVDSNSGATVTIGAGAASASTTGANQKTAGNSGGQSTITMTQGTLTANGGSGGIEPLFASLLGFNAGGGGGGGAVSATGSWFSPPINRAKAGRAGGTAVLNAGVVTFDMSATTPQPIFGGGGAFGHEGSTAFSQNSSGGPAFPIALLNNEPFMGAGGTGSNTTGTIGATFGAGGGGAAATSGTVTSGAGANGGALIFVVRGLVSAAIFENKHLQIP